MKTTLIIVLIFFITEKLCSQEIEIKSLKNWQLKGYARSALRLGDIYTAVDFYEEYNRRNPEDMEVSMNLADLYFESKNYLKAILLYKKAFELNNKKYQLAIFYYAEALKAESKYDSALTFFLQFRDLNANQERRNLYSYLVNVEIESCEFALRNSFTNNNLKIIHLDNSINKIHLESAPLIYNDSVLIYSSTGADTVLKIETTDEVNLPVNRFYSAKLSKNIWQGQFEAPEPFYNFENQNTANGVFSTDRQRFYFTKASRNWKNKFIGTLYMSKKIKGVWQNPVKLDQRINQKKYTSTQPAIGECYEKNYEIIYFISDRPGGWGGMDIWYTVYDKSLGTYKKPINAGGYINTPANEITPFYDNESKILFFSSNGLAGYGGYDIFKSKGAMVNWTAAENAGIPLNSSFDDLYYSKFRFKEQGFIVSNRSEALSFKNPNCCYDIFEFSDQPKQEKKLTGVIKPDTVISNSAVTTSVVSRLKQSIDNNLALLDEMDKEKKDKINEIKTYKNGGLNPVSTNKIDSTGTQNIVNQSVAFGNIYFDFNKSDLTPESKNFIDTTLLFVMLEYPAIVVEIGAHTDNIGSDVYNMDLSQKRAESVVKYLVNKGIEKERLVPVGYGKTRPIVPFVDSEGKDIPESREKNRRIEFKLLGVLHE